ncbi:lipopolysaccharide transport system permease protein [Seonamhaeicola aphaedonensis]|uniref:Transport permease protein n=1 Tax=Seonamhaeicola aphaedonensis TaxID=1461338 RepID=A0A3D9HFZ0_9FLAO|nr:lipopolysaccharide transport system permease protein [Seonamhaeicola aphaedonensis]
MLINLIDLTLHVTHVILEGICIFIVILARLKPQSVHTSKESPWLYTISSKRKLVDFNFKEIWQYKDLMFLFVRRNVIAVYKQTILGPLWYLIQPLFTALTFTIIFNKVANIDTGTVPPFLFNLAGISVWAYFKNCLTGTSNTFSANAGMFSKVYFPRVIIPLSVIITNLVKFGIQLLIFIGFYVYYYSTGSQIQINKLIVLFPVLVMVMGLFGLGIGMLISSMVTKYKDLKFLIGFGVQLLMYLSAVMYPLSLMREKLPRFAWLVEYNPMAYVIETARYMLLSDGVISWPGLIYTTIVTVLVLFFGLLVFNATEKRFIDTI